MRRRARPSRLSRGRPRGSRYVWATDTLRPESRRPAPASYLKTSTRRLSMADNFEYISHARLEYRDGSRHAYLGDVPEPVVYGVQGALRQYYGVKDGPPVASTLDHIAAAVAG